MKLKIVLLLVLTFYFLVSPPASAQLAAPTLSSPSNNLSTATVRQNLQWSRIAAATGYTFQIDTSASFNSPMLYEASQAQTSSTPQSRYHSYLHYNTNYYWRVRAYNATDTSAWSAVWTFHTDISPYLTSPSNDTNPNSTYYTRITFGWNYFYGSSGYTLQVDTSSDFTSPLLRNVEVSSSISNTTNLTQVVNYLNYGTRYYWRVRAYHQDDTSGWSAVRQFHTQSRPTLYSPNNDTNPANTYYTRIYFSWNNARGSTSYTLQVDTTPAFSSPMLRTLTTTSSVSNTDTYIEQVVNHLHYGTRYYWRVRAINSNDTSDWSLTREFYTQYRPTLYSPTDASTGMYTRIYFSWNNARGSTSYTLQIDTTTDFSSPLLRTFTTTNSVSNTDTYVEQVVNYLHYGTHYYWRVRAINSNDTSDWSVVRQLTTSVRPTLYSPSNNASGQSISSLYLYFYNHRGTTSYIIQLDTTPLFNSSMLRTVNKTNSVTNTDNTLYTQLSNLRYGTTYYWRVKAYQQNDSSEWSQTWHFTTTYNNVSGPILTSPGNDSVGVAHNAALLSWQLLADMAGYRYWVSTNSSFSDTVAMGNTSLTFTYLTNLYPSTTYYWSVQGNYATGHSSWATAWHFTTADVPLAAPALVSPVDHGNVPASSVTLAWQSVYGALTYQVQFSFDSTFQSTVSSYTTADTHYALGGLPLNMTYYWRVRSANNNATSDWSTVWTFNTNNCLPTSATIDTAICEGGSYWFFGTPLSSSGTYTHTLPNAQGCDSIVTLHLNVIPVITHDTVFVHDTTYINVYIHDTTVVNNYIHDTTYIDNYIHDTTIVILHDTTIVTFHDTTIVDHYIHDTTYINVYIHDTTIVHDTIVNSQLSTFNLTVSSVQQIGIAVGSGRFADSTVVEIAAIPVCGNHFVQWSDGNTENPRHILVTDDITLLATFDVDEVGVTNVDATSTTITVEGNILTVQGAAGQPIRIFDELGRLLATHDNLPATHSFRLPATGVYLIQIGTAPAHRVVVR